MTEGLHFHFSLSCIGEENGNPLQCSCLEKPRDWGAWWADVYGVTQSRTRLKQLSSKEGERQGWQNHTAEWGRQWADRPREEEKRKETRGHWTQRDETRGHWTRGRGAQGREQVNPGEAPGVEKGGRWVRGRAPWQLLTGLHAPPCGPSDGPQLTSLPVADSSLDTESLSS